MAYFQPTESRQSILDSLPTANSNILELLISEVQVYPILWNKASSEYKETHKKRLVGQKLLENLELRMNLLKQNGKT